MLKTCFECITGALGGDENEYSRANGSVENTYSPVNGDEDPNMFTIPRILNDNDTFTVAGKLKANPQKFSLFITSGKTGDVPCAINVDFTATITVEARTNGTSENVGPDQNIPTQDYFTANLRDFEFQFKYANDRLNIMVDQSHLHEYQLRHDVNNLKYIQLSGDVEKVNSLSFRFA